MSRFLNCVKRLPLYEHILLEVYKIHKTPQFIYMGFFSNRNQDGQSLTKDPDWIWNLNYSFYKKVKMALFWWM